MWALSAKADVLKRAPRPHGDRKSCAVNFGHSRKGCLDEIEVHIPQAHEFSSDIEQVCFFNATILGIFFITLSPKCLLTRFPHQLNVVLH